MTNQSCHRNVVRATSQAAVLLFVLQGNAAYGQDLMASITRVPTVPDAALVPMPAPVVSSFGRPDRLQQEAFLRSAPIVKVRGVKAGVTGTQRASLSAGRIAHDASIQSIDQAMLAFQSAKGTELNFRDFWGYNVAAYRLGVMLGLDNIPVSVARNFNSRPAAFTWWIDDVMMDERARAAQGVKPPVPAAWSAQVHVMRVFDELIANTDRNQGNMLIDRDWKLWLIDHSRAFRLHETLRAPVHVRRCDRALLTRLKALTREGVDEELGDYLTSSERAALLRRRDVLVGLIESLGPTALYDRSVSRP
jgi:hypothetical protein